MRRWAHRPVPAITAVLLAGSLGAACAPADGQAGGVRDEIRQLVMSDGTADGELAAAEEEYARRLRDYVVGCMTEAGFRYEMPVPPPLPKASLGLPEEEFARQYGFGIATLIDYHPPGERGVDPNAAYWSQLEPDSQQAYLEHAGRCHQRAIDELGPSPGELSAAASDELVRIQQAAQADPRVQEAERRYADCVASHGFEGSSGEALQAVVEERVAPLRSEYESYRNELVRNGEDVSQLTLADVLDPDQLAQLADIQQWEIRAALADQECGELLYPVVEEVTDEHLQRYLDGEG